ncbi:MAG: hypothetical protein IPG90_15575 [Bacteroidetes bacterium]|nr:hypothetical protein [Bacteroidota bacterium]
MDNSYGANILMVMQHLQLQVPEISHLQIQQKKYLWMFYFSNTETESFILRTMMGVEYTNGNNIIVSSTNGRIQFGNGAGSANTCSREIPIDRAVLPKEHCFETFLHNQEANR